MVTQLTLKSLNDQLELKKSEARREKDAAKRYADEQTRKIDEMNRKEEDERQQRSRRNRANCVEIKQQIAEHDMRRISNTGMSPAEMAINHDRLSRVSNTIAGSTMGASNYKISPKADSAFSQAY
jgi:hypothetical protein